MIARYRGVLFFLCIVAAVAGLAVFEARQPEPALLVPTSVPLPSAAGPTATAAPLRVYVSGAVHHPDVYELPAGAIVRDAITAAGGAEETADLEQINLALPLHDADQVHVPRQGEAADIPPLRAAQSGTLNINTAGLAALEELPGIGPALAQRIIDYRQAHGPFSQVDDLQAVEGIGPSILDEIRDLITTK